MTLNSQQFKTTQSSSNQDLQPNNTNESKKNDAQSFIKFESLLGETQPLDHYFEKSKTGFTKCNIKLMKP